MDKKLNLLVVLAIMAIINSKTGLVYAGSTPQANPVAVVSSEANVVNPIPVTSNNFVALLATVNLNPYGTVNGLVNFESVLDKDKNRRRLNEDEAQERQVNNALDWAQETVQNFDGIPVISQSAYKLILIGQEVNILNKKIKKKYHLHLDADDSSAAVTYKAKF